MVANISDYFVTKLHCYHSISRVLFRQRALLAHQLFITRATMGRRSGRQGTLNSSVVTLTNNSMLADEEPYHEFIKRFNPKPLDESIELIGCDASLSALGNKIEFLLNNANEKPLEQDFALITGPPKSGKTTVVQKLVSRYSRSEDPEKPARLAFFYLDASWALEKQFGESRLRSLFDEAIKKAPSLIFIDKVELICAVKRSQNDVRERLFNVLLGELEGLTKESAKVLFLAATSHPELLNPQLKETCLFDSEIRFGLPEKKDRASYLTKVLEQIPNELIPGQIEGIAEATHCYTFIELHRLTLLARQLAISEGQSLDLPVFDKALSLFKPIAVKSVATPCQPVYWTDIGGYEHVKKKLKSIITSVEDQESISTKFLRPRIGALLYGPPGCSKTMLAQALATESGYNFICVNGPELFRKYVGDTEAEVRRLYKNAREIAPCIVFFDEIDGFCPPRGDNQNSSIEAKVVTQLLPVLNGVEPLDRVITLAATNRPNRVDRALLRYGRLDQIIYIPLPDEKDRRDIFKLYLRLMPLKLDYDITLDEMLDELALKSEGYSGADIACVCKVAGQLARDDGLIGGQLEQRHLMAAFDEVQASVIDEDLKVYESFQKRYQPVQKHPGKKSSLQSQQHSTNTLTRLMRQLSIKRKGK